MVNTFQVAKSSVASDETLLPVVKNPVFQKWNNPIGLPPKINFFKFIAATRAWQRQAKERGLQEINIASETVRSVEIVENTYRMEPERGQHFAPVRVEKILSETLHKRLKSVKYSAEGCRITAIELAADIKRKVKEMDFPRYKIVSDVLITENRRQGTLISSRSMWNHNTDNFATYTYRNATLIVVATVYGVYYE